MHPPTAPTPALAPTPTAAPGPAPATKSTISQMLSDLPSYGTLTNFTPLPVDDFTVHLPAPSKTAPTRIRIERTRCLIRALRSKSNFRKRPSSTNPSNDSNLTLKRRRSGWAALEREQKQACLKVALTAATRDNTSDTLLTKLKRGWRENPRRKQMVTVEVRRALCRSLTRWSVADLNEYLTKAGVQGCASSDAADKSELVQRVHEHLMPEGNAS